MHVKSNLMVTEVRLFCKKLIQPAEKSTAVQVEKKIIKYHWQIY